MANEIRMSVVFDNKGLLTLKQIGDEAEKQKKRTEDAFGSMGSNIESIFKKIAAAAVAAFTVSAIINYSKEIINLGEQLGNLSLRTGISVEDLDRLRQVAAKAGVGFEEIGRIVSLMNRKLSEAATVGGGEVNHWLKQFNINMQELLAKAPADQFQEIARGIMSIENPMLRDAAAFAFFGKSASELIPLFEKLKKGIGDVPVVIDKEQARVMAEFEDKLKDTGEEFKKLGAILTTLVLPPLTDLLELSGKFLKSDIVSGAINFFKSYGASQSEDPLQKSIKASEEELKRLKELKVEKDKETGWLSKLFSKPEGQNWYDRSIIEEEKKLEQLKKLVKVKELSDVEVKNLNKASDVGNRDTKDFKYSVEGYNQAAVDAAKKMDAEILAINLNTYKARLAILELEKQAYRELKVDEFKITEWAAAKTKEIDLERTKLTMALVAEVMKLRGDVYGSEKKSLDIRLADLRKAGVDEFEIAKWKKAKLKEIEENKDKANISFGAEIFKLKNDGLQSELELLKVKEMELRKSGLEEVKITEYIEIAKKQVRARYTSEDATLQTKSNEFFKHQSFPSEGRRESKIKYNNQTDYITLEDYKKQEEMLKSFQEEYARAWLEMGKARRQSITDSKSTSLISTVDIKEIKELPWSEGKIVKINKNISEENKISRDMDIASLNKWYYETKKIYGESEQLIELYYAKLDAIHNKYKSDLEKWTETAQSFADQLDSIVINMAEGFTNNFSDAFISFIDGTKSAEQAFREFASTFLKEMAAMILKQTILNSLKEAMNSGTSSGSGLQSALGWLGKAIGGSGGTTGNSYADPYGHAKGSIFSPQGIMAFAKGDVVSRPTMFQFAKGTGLMGEAGPEGILPLARNAKGELGVKSGGGRGISISNNITISNSGNMSETEQRQQGRMVSDMLDAKIMDSLMKYERSRSAGGIR